MAAALFESYDLKKLTLSNRIVMAPMTRCRATTDHVPTDLMATHYAQRADAGLLITEGASPAPEGLGYARIPGLYNQTHVAAWRKITDAVHEKGGHIFVQLMHTGRVSHPLNMPEGTKVLAPSAIAHSENMWTDQQGMQELPVPQAMSEEDIQKTIEAYANSAELAIEAGLDGVELHAANGYLIDQFLNVASNQRNDRWGGSVENRARFALEVAKLVAARIGSERTGIRLSPYGVFNGMTPDDEMENLSQYLATELSKLGLVYIHIVDHSALGAPEVPWESKNAIRKCFGGTIILAGGYGGETANADLQAGRGDLIAFGRPFISNPDLVQRLQENAQFAEPDMDTFYTPDEKGYNDYPLLNA